MLEGHAFIVEAAVSMGSKLLKQGINVYRFANRIPLLFEVPVLPPKLTSRVHVPVPAHSFPAIMQWS